MSDRWRKGTIVELTRNWKAAGLKKGAIGNVVKSRKERGYDTYWYEVRFKKFTGDWPLRVHQYSLERGRHRVRDFFHDTQTWHCRVCNRKVKAPKPCPICGGYGIPKKKTRGISTPHFFTYAGQKVCAFCEARLPQERKTDGKGEPLAVGDVVTIVGGPINYMHWIGLRAKINRLNRKSITIEFSDGVRAYWSYRMVAKAIDREPTLSGDQEEAERIGKAFGQIFR